MLTFLLDNIGTIVVLLIVVAVVAAIIISHFRAKKKGKSSCGIYLPLHRMHIRSHNCHKKICPFSLL